MADTEKLAGTRAGQKVQSVQDELGRIHVLEKKIAEGGQGAVVTIKGQPRWLLKLCKWPSADPRAKVWAQQIAAVKRLPIEDFDLPFAMPKALVLKPRVGYLMELMDGLVPLEDLLIEAQNAMLEGRGLEGFLTSGGLKRRLAVLARLARVLAKLHGLGLAHGDLSPKNVFVSQSVEHAQVWLIDCDNLTYAVRNSTLQLYTPDYGAPELVREDAGISTYTDIWSFAVMAFQLLSLLHPFKSGDMVDADPELESAALRGELPWIDHLQDGRNSTALGISRSTVCTPELTQLFDRCFRGGAQTPEARPLMTEWAEAFEAALALQTVCEPSAGGCGSSILWSETGECPFCESTASSQQVIRLHHFVFCPLDQLPEGSVNKDRWIKSERHQVVRQQPVQLRNAPPGAASYADSEVIAEMVIKGHELCITPSGDKALYLQMAGHKSPTRIRGRVNLPRRELAHALHVGELNNMHDAWNFKW